jgi:hypothetical protein
MMPSEILTFHKGIQKTENGVTTYYLFDDYEEEYTGGVEPLPSNITLRITKESPNGRRLTGCTIIIRTISVHQQQSRTPPETWL